MTLTLGAILHSAGIDPADAQAIRHAYVREHEDTGSQGIHADSTDEEILQYTRRQWVDPRRFPLIPPRFWVVFLREGGDRARLWSVVENRGEVDNDGVRRSFDLVASDHLADLRNRLVIGWRSPRTWRLNGPTAAAYPVMEIADAEPVPFPGFDRLVLDYAQLQAVMREHRYASWRTALSSVVGIYLITDTVDGRQYVGKADGAEKHPAAVERLRRQRARQQRRAAEPGPEQLPLLAAPGLRPGDPGAVDQRGGEPLQDGPGHPPAWT